VPLFDVQNNVPFLSVIIEPIVAIAISVTGIQLIRKYFQRKNTATLYLALAIICYSLAIWFSATGKILDYYSNVTQEEHSNTDFTIAIAYCFTALANIFSMGFIALIFREENNQLPLVFGTLNGITIGLILSKVSFSNETYDRIFPFLIYHILISTITYTMLIRSSFDEANKTEDKIPKTGFKLIGYYGVFIILVFVFFIFDLVWGMIRGHGFTPFYYIGWSSGAVASFFAYFGYVMPDWLKKRLES
jgi:hypothetical protein